MADAIGSFVGLPPNLKKAKRLAGVESGARVTMRVVDCGSTALPSSERWIAAAVLVLVVVLRSIVFVFWEQSSSTPTRPSPG